MTNCNKPFFSVTFILGVEQITRKAFMAEFTNLLAFMNDDERDRAVRRYEQMFDQAGPEREETPESPRPSQPARTRSLSLTLPALSPKPRDNLTCGLKVVDHEYPQAHFTGHYGSRHLHFL